VADLIKLKKLDGNEIAINAELIETVQATPDTIITLTTNKKIIVNEELDEVIDKILLYHRRKGNYLRVVKE